MSVGLYTFVPILANAMFVLSLLMKVYRRSISSFIAIMMFFISSNLAYYGFATHSIVAICFFMIVMFIRSVSKPENDTFIVKKYNGHERRNRKWK